MSLIDDCSESQMFQFEDRNLEKRTLDELPLLQKLLTLAQSMVSLIK